MNENPIQEELDRCRAILIALFDLHIKTHVAHRKKMDNYLEARNAPLWNPNDDTIIALFEQYKRETEELYQKGKLEKLKKRLKGFTSDIVKAGDVTFSKYIKEVTGYDFQVANTIAKKISQISKRGKFKNEQQYYEALETLKIVKESPEYFDSQTHNKIEKISEMLDNFDNTEEVDEDDEHFYKELSSTFSPDGICKLLLIEAGRDENYCYTQVLIEFGDMSGAGVYSVDKINSGIKTYWKDNHTIVIETKKEFRSSQRWEQVQSYQDIIQVIYIEE